MGFVLSCQESRCPRHQIVESFDVTGGDSAGVAILVERPVRQPSHFDVHLNLYLCFLLSTIISNMSSLTLPDVEVVVLSVTRISDCATIASVGLAAIVCIPAEETIGQSKRPLSACMTFIRSLAFGYQSHRYHSRTSHRPAYELLTRQTLQTCPGHASQR